MANVTDYDSLVENVAAYDERADDTDFVARIPGFIHLFEASLSRNIRGRETSFTTTLTTDANGYATLPSDFLRFRSFTTVNGNLYRSLNPIAAGAVATLYPIDTASDAVSVSISGNNIRLSPTAASSVSLEYDRRFVGLGPSNQTNWVLDDNPDLYLAGTLAHAAAYLKDWNESAVFSNQAAMFLDEVNAQYAISLYNMAGVTIEGSTP